MNQHPRKRNIIMLNTETLNNIQQEVVNVARADNDLFRAIIQYFIAVDGIGTRTECIKFVANAIGLSDEQASIKHDTSSGSNSFLESAVDFTKLDMRNGEFGEAPQNLETDNGTWMLDNAEDIDVSKSVCHYNVKAANTKAKRETLAKQFKIELLNAYKGFSELAKKQFSNNGGTMEKCIAHMFQNYTATESLNLF